MLIEQRANIVQVALKPHVKRKRGARNEIFLNSRSLSLKGFALKDQTSWIPYGEAFEVRFDISIDDVKHYGIYPKGKHGEFVSLKQGMIFVPLSSFQRHGVYYNSIDYRLDQNFPLIISGICHHKGSITTLNVWVGKRDETTTLIKKQLFEALFERLQNERSI